MFSSIRLEDGLDVLLVVVFNEQWQTCISSLDVTGLRLPVDYLNSNEYGYLVSFSMCQLIMLPMTNPTYDKYWKESSEDVSMDTVIEIKEALLLDIFKRPEIKYAMEHNVGVMKIW